MNLRLNGTAARISSGSSSEEKDVPPCATTSLSLLTARFRNEHPPRFSRAAQHRRTVRSLIEGKRRRSFALRRCRQSQTSGTTTNEPGRSNATAHAPQRAVRTSVPACRYAPEILSVDRNPIMLASCPPLQAVLMDVAIIATPWRQTAYQCLTDYSRRESPTTPWQHSCQASWLDSTHCFQVNCARLCDI